VAVAVSASKSAPSLQFRRIRALLLLLSLVGLVAVAVQMVGSDQAGWTTAADKGPDQAPPSATDTPSPDQTLRAAVAAHSGQLPHRLSIALRNLDSGLTATYGADVRYATASIVKVNILAGLLLQRGGELSSSQQALARRMIQNSDNHAATALWRQLGGGSGLQSANQRLGLTATVAGPDLTWGLTTTTAADQLRLLTAVFTDDSPLNAKARSYLQTLMGHVAADQAWGVTAVDSGSGTKHYVKNGWLPRSDGWIVNSIGAAEYNGHLLLVVALSDGQPAMDRGIAALEEITIATVPAVTRQ
jgi:beta-lactamase class A